MVKESGNTSPNAILEDGSVNYNFIGGNLLSKPEPGEEIVISGISGAFPNSKDVHEFRDNLFNKANMVSENRRWTIKHPEIPTCSGTIPDINRYDSGFFGVHERQSNSLDPMHRMLQEKAVEAIFDAGLHPSDLENTRTGVFIGICFSESDKSWFFENKKPQMFGFTGAARAMGARRLSYFLKLKGPSMTLDSACSSSLYALEHGYRAIRLGEIDTAIIGGTNLCLHPLLALQFYRLGVLSNDGSCKVFDEAGNGYARSEAINVAILQKAKDAKRMYAEILYTKTNCDGYKQEGITFPSKEVQRELLSEIYQECNIDCSTLSYLETHGTGTFVGDPEECLGFDQILTENRKTPLLIGSVKSNIGHSEPAAGLCSLIKCVIGLETGFIPPNIHYNTPKHNIKGLIEGRMKVVDEKIPLQDNNGIMGINSFGFGGGNCHVLIRWNLKEKINDGLPKDDLPRLVCVSGRTREAVDSIFDELNENVLDVEHIKLLHEAFRKNVENHLFRGYTIVSKSGEVHRSAKYSPGNYKSLYFELGVLTEWYDIGSQLKDLPVFSDTLQRIEKCLVDNGYSDIFSNKQINQLDISSILACVAIQMGILDILKLLEIKPKGCFGNPFGELLFAYYEEILTVEETINCAIVINETVVIGEELYELNNINYKKNKADPIDVGSNITNGTSLLERLTVKLQRNNTSTMETRLQQNLINELDKDKLWNGKSTNNKYRSADDFIDNLIHSLYQERQCTDSVILQIGRSAPHCDLEDVTVISIASDGSENHLVEFLKGIGSLYECGYNPQINKLYPSVALPVSRGTRMISPYIKWKHTREWFVADYNSDVRRHGAKVTSIRHTDYPGHIIDGRNLLPATGYLCLVWEIFGLIQGITMNDMQVVIENCRFLRATNIPSKGEVKLHITIQTISGYFEVSDESDAPLVTGRIYLGEENAQEINHQPIGLKKDIGPPLNTKDIYKELRLRGYNYKGKFRAIQECDGNASKGFIKWEDDWVPFIDNMLQMKILQQDSRLLYVPIYISQLKINAKSHIQWINKEYKVEGKSPVLSVLNNHSTGIISCGGIHIKGLIASSIHRKKYLGKPVLENYKFIPNIASLSTEASVRINVQIILENVLTYKVKAVELIDEFSKTDAVPLIPMIHSALEDIPLIQPTLKILSKAQLEVDFEVEDQKLANEHESLIVIASNILKRPEILKEALASLVENGFIISREPSEFDPSSDVHPNVKILTMHRTSTETLLLIQKETQIVDPTCIKISSSDNFSWIPKLQASKKNVNENILLYSQDEPYSGILGLANCLRREPGGANIRSVFIVDEAKEFDQKDSFYSSQIKKNMAVNVYKNGQWGTYRHILLDDSNTVESQHCYVNVTVRGDLSSLKWIEGPLRHNMPQPVEKQLVNVHYAALNFRDVMTASGKINVDAISQNRLEQECVQGFEFSGIDESGRRVMGLLTNGALSTLIMADSYTLYEIPDTWSLEDAATVPVVYGTVIYALNECIRMKRGETILIHSGTGGIGQAAIRVALHQGCKVYTTVGTKEKRDFLKHNFSEIKDHHIGNSHDTSFEQMIFRETNGRGVDIVLNSLAEDKLLASVRCLAKGGRFVEIGKFDMASNNTLNLLLFKKGASFHGIMLDLLMAEDPFIKARVGRFLMEGIRNGAIQPLSRVVFKHNEVEQAFRFMATGKHMGKVLVQVHESEVSSTSSSAIRKFRGIPRYHCDPEKSYVIAGGLGGFGLELADWLVLRGARKLVLTSRTGIRTGYQSLRIRIWQSYGTTVKISTADITTKTGCKKLIEESQELGPISALFNLAVVLADSIFENQTPESFITSFGPKAIATEYLDELSREMCPDLSEFVVFSSVSCGRGNAGQTNYGMANSVMERICEKRKQDGYPALAIEWGAIGDVGLVAEMQEEHTELEISGTLQQRISSCLQVLDSLLRQKDAAVVSSMVVAEKRGKVGTADNIVDAVINILGVTDRNSVSLHSTLAELGMDSMTAVEIKQTLEREFDVYLTANDMRTMTLQRLKDTHDEMNNGDKITEPKNIIGLDAVIRRIGEEAESNIPYMLLKSNIDETAQAPNLLLFPGLEGFASMYKTLAARLNAHVVCLQFRYDIQNKTILDMAESLIPSVKEHLKKDEPFKIVAYSFGTVVALEVVAILESQGYTGTIICLDGSPTLIKEMLKTVDTESEQVLETAIICQLASLYIPQDVVLTHKEYFLKCTSWDERLNHAVAITQHRFRRDENYQRSVANGIYQRIKALMVYSPSYGKLQSNVKLCKPTHDTIPGLAKDCNLSEIFEKPVDIQFFEGNHVTLLDNELLVEVINEYIR